MDEHMAIARLQQGDISGLETLVRTYQARAVRCAFLVVHDQALALDLAQTAFVKAYERIGQFDARRPFGPWFFTILLRDARKAVARQGSLAHASRLDADGTDDLIDPELNPEQLWEQQEVARTVLAALAELGPAERAAIVQRYYLGLSEAEMAEIADCPQGTIKSRLHAARDRLRLLLQPLIQDSEV
jgi:RNA polymerase sigma-70 factor (ECF subfamily)